MKIARLHAEKVHGYLPIDVEFFDDLTFLTGLNGCGKTSALRLLMALLTPNLDELGSIAFASAAVTIRDGDQETVVSSVKTTDAITLSISTIPQILHIGSTELELVMEARRREEARSPVLEQYQQHVVFQKIKAISTPMFLGLDRRFYAPGAITEDLNDARRREYMSRRFWPEDTGQRNAAVAALVEINYLVVTRLQEVRASQEQLDERLRAEFFAKAFEYKPSDIMGKPTRVPSRTDIESYRQQLAKIERAAEPLKIPVPEIQTALTHFFERMSAVVDSMEKSTQAKKPAKKSAKRTAERVANEPVFPDRAYIEWIINKPQADRILEHLKLLDEYVERRNALRDPINRFSFAR